jgi:hypothetical protein
MKQFTVIASILLGVCGLTVPIHAAPQQSGQDIKQKVTKKTVTVAAHTVVRYKGSPQFVPVEGASISYATNTPLEVINFGKVFYVNVQDIWLESADAEGPWIPAPSVPQTVSAIICSQINAYPLDPYQLCALPWTSGLTYAVWKPVSN